MLGVFAAVFLFTFLSGRFKASDEEANAASLANFDPGYIISDWQMGNYTSMSEAEIQSFLTSKNSCPNRDYNYYLRLSTNTNYKWHWDNGHFICLSEEKFGDGEVIGSGDTAAHIIWQAAQDYKINPQALLVLLQKETGLITDPIPNNGDYRKATGYGCPDTAPCSSQYYGFKNQIRKAAALFRTVLDGGWTNYPLGNNYVQYNPNPGCGGSVVNIRSLATSALYRYTPYQPNAGAIAAGYGTAYCGAYGNRNFYLYFQDWFGGITSDGYSKMDTARYMKLSKDTYKINPHSLTKDNLYEKGLIVKFTTKVFTSDDKLCLRSEYDSARNNNLCILFEDLTEFDGLDYVPLAQPREFYIPRGTSIFDSSKGTISSKTTENQRIYFDEKAYWNGKQCLRSNDDTQAQTQRCIFYDDLIEIDIQEENFIEMINPRVMTIKKEVAYYDIDVKEMVGKKLQFGLKDIFDQKTVLDNGEVCLRTLDDSINHIHRCVLLNALDETSSEFIKMDNSRSLRVTEDSDFVTIAGLYYEKQSKKNEVYYFVDKTYVNDKICLRTREDKQKNISRCLFYDNLENDENAAFINMDNVRKITVNNDSVVVDIIDVGKEIDKRIGSLEFVDKAFYGSKLCLRTKEDAELGKTVCYFYDTLEDK